MDKYKLHLNGDDPEAEKFFYFYKIVEAKSSTDALLQGRELVAYLKKENPYTTYALYQIEKIEKV